MLNTLLCQALTLFINPCLALDPELETLLTTLKGKSLGIVVSDWHIALSIHPTNKNITIRPSTTHSDVLLTGKLFDLAGLALAKNPQTILAKGTITLKGPLGILTAYQRFFQRLDLDWEGFLATFMGDTLAHQLMKSVHGVIDLKKKNHQRSIADITDFFQEESQLLPPREEVEDFFEDVRDLTDAVDRLAAKVAQLSSHHPRHTPSK